MNINNATIERIINKILNHLRGVPGLFPLIPATLNINDGIERTKVKENQAEDHGAVESAAAMVSRKINVIIGYFEFFLGKVDTFGSG